MLKKTIQHKDFDGNDTETTCYFNLTKAEAIELNIRSNLELIGQSKDQNEIMDTWRRILKMSYGKRLSNGDFVKEGFAAFAASEAYSELFMEIWQDSEAASAFIKSILPAGIIEAGEGEQETKSDIPEHLRSHPSMQSNLKKKEAPAKTLDNFDSTPAKQPYSLVDQGNAMHAQAESAITSTTANVVDDQEYKNYLAYKASQGAKTNPEVGSVPDHLI